LTGLKAFRRKRKAFFSLLVRERLIIALSKLASNSLGRRLDL